MPCDFYLRVSLWDVVYVEWQAERSFAKNVLTDINNVNWQWPLNGGRWIQIVCYCCCRYEHFKTFTLRFRVRLTGRNVDSNTEIRQEVAVGRCSLCMIRIKMMMMMMMLLCGDWSVIVCLRWRLGWTLWQHSFNAPLWDQQTASTAWRQTLHKPPPCTVSLSCMRTV